MTRQVTPRAAARNVVRGGIDVGHHGVDRRVRIGRQACAVAPDRLEPIDGAPDPEQWLVMFRDFGTQRRSVPSWRLVPAR
jgi:hypothetical protein